MDGLPASAPARDRDPVRTHGGRDLLRRRVSRDRARRGAPGLRHPGGAVLHRRPPGLPARALLRAGARHREPDVRDPGLHGGLAADGAGGVAQLRTGVDPHALGLHILARRHPRRGRGQLRDDGDRRAAAGRPARLARDRHRAAAARQSDHRRSALRARGGRVVSAERARGLLVRNLRPEDFAAVIELCRRVYPDSRPWTVEQLASHLEVFPEGQFVVEERSGGAIRGLASSLIVRWDDYDFHAEWREWTAAGHFTNHDPAHGRTLLGAEVMVDPEMQRRGIGQRLYAARRELVLRLGLRRIRAGARLRGYHRYAARLNPEEYVERIVRGELRDPTLSFQLREGFEVVAVVHGYLRNDPESLGYAAVIEWLNPEVARPEDSSGRDPRFRLPVATS
ncbi:MAG: GNAT family N-acetyltransferase [Thermoanaerobaculia bacterium]|nr:MAG: GNAT family N-acetyltransferase [Thermoanaerobaculia bacterium]